MLRIFGEFSAEQRSTTRRGLHRVRFISRDQLQMFDKNQAAFDIGLQRRKLQDTKLILFRSDLSRQHVAISVSEAVFADDAERRYEGRLTALPLYAL